MDAVDFLVPWVDLATTRAYLRGMSEHDPKEPPDTIQVIEVGPHLVDLSTITAVSVWPLRGGTAGGELLPDSVSINTTDGQLLSAYPDEEAAQAAYRKLRAAWLSRPGVQHILVD